MKISEYKATTKKLRKQPEGNHQKTLGLMLNGILKPRLNPNIIFWTYSGAGERKSLKTGALQKRKGLMRGDFDYRFEIKEGDIMRVVYIETKSSKGSLNEFQKAFQKNHQNLSNAKCYTSKNIEESLRILKEEKILL
jgi:hypothetical protein